VLLQTRWVCRDYLDSDTAACTSSSDDNCRCTHTVGNHYKGSDHAERFAGCGGCHCCAPFFDGALLVSGGSVKLQHVVVDGNSVRTQRMKTSVDSLLPRTLIQAFACVAAVGCHLREHGTDSPRRLYSNRQHCWSGKLQLFNSTLHCLFCPFSFHTYHGVRV